MRPDGVGGYYRLVPGTDVVPIGDEAVLFRSDTLLLKLEGASTVLFIERILPLLDGRHSLADMAAAFPQVPVRELRYHLDELVKAHVLSHGEAASEPSPATAPEAPFHAMLQALGLDDDPRAQKRLREMHVIVFGLEAHGAYLADMLVRSGVGHITLVDPYPCQPANYSLLPLPTRAGEMESRQSTVKRALEAHTTKAEISVFAKEILDAGAVEALAEKSNFLAGCYDRGFAAAHQWINRASLKHRVPAIFGEIRGYRLDVGPLVLPHESACLLCWKMRMVSCQDDFRDAIAYEEFLDRQRNPTLHQRPSLPPASAILGSLMAVEILKTVLALGHPSLVGKVEEIDLLTGDRSRHSVVQRPDCPACKKKAITSCPPLGQVANASPGSGKILELAERLVSPRCGIIRNLERVTKDPSEPTLPYIVRAELANHRFLTEREDASIICSGKGMTWEEARKSALGEAVERYSSSLWGADHIVYARRAELDDPALDPRRLVLYRPEQYATLKYAPYEDSSVLGWVQARSLVSGELVYVPAIAVFMAYDTRSPEEFLFPVTSNGLAAAPNPEQAVLSASYEVLERDAFLITWLNQLPCQRIDPMKHPDPAVVDLCRAYQRRGVSMELYRLPVDHCCHVFLGMGVQASGNHGPAVVVGLGANLDSALAARSALLEVGQVRPALRIRLREPATRRRMEELVEDPGRVAKLEDHDLLYASSKKNSCFDFLRCQPATEFDWPPAPVADDASARLSWLANDLASRGGDILYCDLTSEDLGNLGIHTARAIIPDFQPIYFGEQERRLGGTRLFEAPRRMGLRSDSVAVSELNSDPHPLA